MTQPTEEELKNMTPEQFAEIQKQNCIFCKIISGQIPSKKVYEDSDFFAILDINPATEGHTLLMPKKHIQIMPQMDQELVGKMAEVSKKISAKLLKAFSVSGTSVFIANGAIAGQKSPHFIVHIIPRKDNDDIKLNPSLLAVDETKFKLLKSQIMKSMGLVTEPKPVAKKEKPNAKEVSKEDLDKISKLFT